MVESKKENLVWLIFAILGALFLTIGLVLFNRIFDYDNKVDTLGTITEIVTLDNSNHEVYVSYKVHGKSYQSELNGYSSNFYEGKEIEIYYDKDNPEKIGMKSLDLLFLIFPLVGLIFLMIGGIGLLVKINGKKRDKKLKETGELIYATYNSTVLNTMYQVNHQNPYKIICSWTDKVTNQQYTFKSRNIWTDPTKIIEERNIKQFPVYLDKEKKKYYVDIDILK